MRKVLTPRERELAKLPIVGEQPRRRATPAGAIGAGLIVLVCLVCLWG